MGYECIGPRQAAAPDRGRRTWSTSSCNVTPNPNQPYVGANAFAHKGGMHVAGVNRDARTFEHVDPADVGADRRVLVSELSGKGTVAARADVDDADRRARDRARQGAGAPRLPVRGRRRLLRPADPQGDGRLRAAVPARVVARDRREARRRPGGDRGDDQDLGRRRALRAHRRGQRPGARARQGAARGDRRALPAPARHPAGQLQGAHPRRDQGHRRGHARAARRQRRHRQLGRDRRVREHHRGELGGAGRLARGGHAARRARSAARARRPSALRDPARQAARRRARGAAGAGDAALRPARARARGCRSSRTRLAAPRRTARVGRLERHGGAAPGDPGGRRRGRRRGRHDAVLVRRLGQLPALRERQAGVLRHRPAHAQHRPRPPPRRRSPSARPACCRCTSSATRPTCPRFERLAAERGLWIVEDACEALGADPRRRRAGRRARQPRRCSASTRTSRSPRARAAPWSAPTRPPRSASTPSATRAARPTWAGSTTTGSASTTASTTSPARSASRSSSASTSCSPARARVAALYSEALADVEELELPCPDADGDRRSLVRVRRAAAAAASTATPP